MHPATPFLIPNSEPAVYRSFAAKTRLIYQPSDTAIVDPPGNVERRKELEKAAIVSSIESRG
mgnify:CR=1 FL=1